MGCVHAAAATENFIALEHHSVDNPWWEDLVTGLDKPLVQGGYVTVPEKPGVGVDLNEEVVKEAKKNVTKPKVKKQKVKEQVKKQKKTEKNKT